MIKVFNEKFDGTDYSNGNISDLNIDKKILVKGTVTITEQKTKKSDPYLMVVVKDAFNKSMRQNIFDNSNLYKFLSPYTNTTQKADIYTGMTVNGAYKNIDIKNIALYFQDAPTEEEINNAKETIEEQINDKINTIVSPFLRDIVYAVFADEEFKKLFFTAPATEASSYNYVGGLAVLTLATANMAEVVSEHFNSDDSYVGTLTVNPDILMAGALLCNIGRAYMLTFNSENTNIIKTEDGVLSNDLSIARTIVSNTIDRLSIEKDEAGESKYIVRKDVVTELLHMIESSKNLPQWGSIAVPRTKHAMLLANINSMVFTKGLFENLEKNNPDTRFVKAYDGGRAYFLPSSYIDN